MLLQILLGNRNRRIVGHSLHILLRRHLPAVDQAGQQLEVVDIERRREGVDEPGLRIKRIREGVRSSDRHAHEVSLFGVDVWLAGNVEADCALGGEEHFIVHLVPVGWWARGARWQNEFRNTNSIVWSTLAVRLLTNDFWFVFGTCQCVTHLPLHGI